MNERELLQPWLRGIERSLPPAEQQWSVYFRATGGEGQVLAPLVRFAKESTEELGKTWARVSLNDATSEFILLMCGQNALLRYVKNQTSSDVTEGIVAARALEVAAISGDLHGADLAGAIVRHCDLQNCNLNNADLSDSSWFVGTFRGVAFDQASFRGASVRGVAFTDSTLRDADLSYTTFEVNPHYVTIFGGIWCTSGDKEILLVILANDRIIAITPKTLAVQALVRPERNHQQLTTEDWGIWLLDESDTLDLPSLGHISLDGNGWYWNRDWTDDYLSEGLISEFLESYAAGIEVQVREIKVTIEETNQVLLNLKLHDTTKLPSANTVLRALAISKDGTQVAVVHGSFGEVETASIRSDDLDPGIPLRGFRGEKLEREDWPYTIDYRGASFSSSGDILAFREDHNVVGFWQTSDGEFLGRVVFQTAARGCVMDGATGLPPEFAMANADGKDGWIVEPSSST